jgi:hypothetical protein
MRKMKHAKIGRQKMVNSKVHNIATFDIELDALDIVLDNKDDSNDLAQDAVEKSGRLALAKLLRRLADELEFQLNTNIWDGLHQVEFKAFEEGLNVKFRIALVRRENGE